MKISKSIQILLGTGLVLLSVSHWYPLGINLFELLGAFAHFTLILSGLVLLVAVFLRAPILGSSALISTLICSALLYPHINKIEPSGEGDFSMGQFNLYHNNPSPKGALSQVRLLNLDVIAIQELNTDWKGLVESEIKPFYPYRIEEPWNHCCYGIGFYSKFPILESEVKTMHQVPVIFALLDIDGRKVRVISFHALTPVSPNQTTERNQQMKTIAEFVKKEGLPTIVFGDFNIVPWEQAYKDFLNTSGLNEVDCGFQATYPLDLGLALIPIDHINYSEEFEPTHCGSIPIPGSDHKAVLASFKLKD